MPTGGEAIMRQGPNLLKLARKEQCLALSTRLRSKYKIKYQFYRVFPNGEVQYLHPKDGVYPEQLNPGRQGVGQNFRSIGKIPLRLSSLESKFMICKVRVIRDMNVIVIIFTFLVLGISFCKGNINWVVF